MWSEGVVFFNSFSELKPHVSNAVGNEITTRIEFFAEGAVATFNATIVFWPSWRQHNERNIHSLTRRLKVGHKLRTAVHLN